MNNELQKHKTSDTVKWVLTLLAFILVGVMLIGIICGWFDKKEQIPSDAEQTNIDETTGNVNAELNGGLVVTPSGSNRFMRLTATPLSASESDGIAPLAEDSYTLIATVEPANADDTLVDWAVNWTNASDSWASGKTVSDYVTLTQTSDGSLSARLTCKKAFAAQITVTVSSRHNPAIKATTTADYRERITGVSYVLSANGNDYTLADGVQIPYVAAVTGRSNITKSIGSIASEFSVSATMSLAPELAETIEYHYGDSWGTGFNTSANVSNTFDMIDAFDTCLTPDNLGQYINSEYVDALYEELMNYIKEQDCNAVVFKVTVTNNATGSKTEYSYSMPFDKSTMVVHISSLTLGAPIVF